MFLQVHELLRRRSRFISQQHVCVCLLSSSLGHLVPVVLQLKAVRYYLCKVCYLIVKLCGSIYDEFSIIINCALSKQLEANLVRTTSQEARCAL